VQVSIATANGTLIRRYQAMAGFFQRLRNARALVKKYNAGSVFSDPKLMARAAEKLKKVEAAKAEVRPRESRWPAFTQAPLLPRPRRFGRSTSGTSATTAPTAWARS
jgi:hypothetical protein